MIRHVLCLIALLLLARDVPAQGTIVALYTFDGNANDLSGNNHQGTLHGPQLASDRFGRLNSAFAFDGDDWIEVPHSPDLNFGSSSTFTINAWVKACEDQSEYAGIVAKGPTNTFIPGYQLVVRDEFPEGLISQNDGNFVGVLGTKKVLDSTWHMLTLIVSAPTGLVKMYIDGALSKISRGSGVDPSVRNTANLFIGKERNSTRFAKGAIDDVSIFDYALDEATIGDLFTEGGWPFNAGNGSLSIATPDGLSLCSGGSVRLIASGSLRYTWTPATGLSNPTIANPVASPTTTTTYTVVGVREDYPCGTVTSAQVTVYVGTPTFELGPSPTICAGGSVRIGQTPTGGSPPYRFLWTPATGLDDPTIPNPTASPITTTTYVLTVTDSGGCIGRDTIVVAVTRMQATLSQSALDFGELDGCSSSAERTITLSNASDTAIDLSNLAVTGAGFSVVSVTPMIVPAGRSAVIVVRFAPVVNGAHSGRIAIHSTPCDVDLAVELTGSGQPVAASLSPADIDFGDDLACRTTWRDTMIVVRNVGNRPMTIYPASVAAPFSVVAPVLPLTIAGGASTTLTIRCEPTSDGTFSATLALPFLSGTCADTLRVTLRENRFGSVEAAVAFDTLDFGRLDGCRSEGDSTVMVTNRGTGSFELSDVSVTGTGFVVLGVSPRILAPGATGVITIRFAPGSPGAFLQTLHVHTTPCDADIVVTLSGIGAQVLAAASPAEIDFGVDAECVLFRDSVIIISNRGSDPMVLEPAVVAAPFRVIAPMLPLTIPPGASDTITVRCDPSADGVHDTELRLPYSSGSCVDTLRILLKERREAMALEIVGTTDFGQQFPGAKIERTQFVVNRGTVPVAIDSIVVAPPFAIVSTVPAVPTLLQPNDSILVTTRYLARPGIDSVDLEIFVATPCAGRRAIPLRGSGDERVFCRIYIPRDSARAGEWLPIRLKIDSSAGLKEAGAYGFRATIAFDRTLLYPDSGFEMAVDDSIRRVVITGRRKDNDATLAEIPMTAMLGRIDSTALVIEEFDWVEPVVEPTIETVDGEFVLRDNCPEGGNRQYLRSGRVVLRPVVPNPSMVTAVAEFETAEPGATRLVIVDRLGRRMMLPFNGDPGPGRISLTIDISALPPGVYLLVLETPTISTSQPFEVVR